MKKDNKIAELSQSISESCSGLPDFSDSEFKRVCDMVYDLAGIKLHEGKRALVQARLGKRMRQTGVANLGAYLDIVQKEGGQAELISMLDAISTNTTSFWREPAHFEHFISVALPRAVSHAKKSRESAVRVWSAGCSTGEEPYGLAMIMHDELRSSGVQDVKVLATDLSTHVLSIARNGVYPENRVRAVPPSFRDRYFEQVAQSHERMYGVTKEIRAMVHFARLNLMGSWPMKGPFDVIFCRNVMIYFDKATQAKLVGRYFQLLRSGGLLYIGHSESLTGIDHPYRYVRPTIYEKP
jgi:chemotaxis protein methyltransferase CheR